MKFWMEPVVGRKYLEPISVETLQSIVYPRFSRSLLIICMKHIEDNLEKYKHLDSILPEQIQHSERLNLIRKTCYWEDKNIVFFRAIRASNDCFTNDFGDQLFPFYVDYLLAIPKEGNKIIKAVDKAFNQQLYQIVSTPPKSFNSYIQVQDQDPNIEHDVELLRQRRALRARRE